VSHNIDGEREQVADLLRRIVVDDEFRNLFRADPRGAIAGSGISLSAQAVDQIVQTADLGPSVMAHMAKVEESAKCVSFFYVAVDDQ
jgi:hypothetical protein